MSDDEIIEVVKAHKDGKRIERKSVFWAGDGGWFKYSTGPWNFEVYEYRVSTEFLECWVNVYSAGFRNYYKSRQEAEAFAGDALRIAVHMKEVEKKEVKADVECDDNDYYYPTDIVKNDSIAQKHD